MTSIIRRRLLAAVLLPLCPAYAARDPRRCGEPTPAQTEGPFYKKGAPERASLVEPAAAAVRLVVTGQVLSARDCQPLSDAVLDFWHTDERGEYDNAGYRYRGRQRTDARGAYRLETIVPGAYPGRTRHIHVKVHVPGRRVLTTQLYLPDDPGNRRDGIYRPELEVQMSGAGTARFDFVVDG